MRSGSPVKRLGLLGGGQLGQMFALAATQLGHRVVGLWPEAEAPAQAVCEHWIQADYTDEEALDRLATQVEAVTIEFENVPVEALDYLSKRVPVYPGPNVLAMTQDRLAEKRFIQSLGLPTTSFREVCSLESLLEELKSIGPPAVLKTTRLGYDGKGQYKISTLEAAHEAWQALQPRPESFQPLILESWQALRAECALLGARNASGEIALMPLTQTWHRNHILHRSCWPCEPDIAAFEPLARQMLSSLMTALNLTGVLCAEFFVTTGGELLINELAPRPHNSFHWSIEGCSISQFELQARAMTNLPLPMPTPLGPCLMQNILGESYLTPDQGKSWQRRILSTPTLSLHDYGKSEPRAGRKMGHVTARLPQNSNPWSSLLAETTFIDLS
jgi:5-(carboxyamino)imidazole ribonucleotide synthase